jgi:hypothetical protein
MPGTASRFIPPKASRSVPHDDWYPPPGASADRTVIDANYDAPAIADLVVKTAGYADSGRKQFVHSLGKEGRIRLIPVWVAGEMAPYRRNWSEFGLP